MAKFSGMSGFDLTHNLLYIGNFMDKANKLKWAYFSAISLILEAYKKLKDCVPQNTRRCNSPLMTHLYVWILWVDVSIGEVWKVLEIQDEGFGLLLRLRLWKNTNRAVLGVGKPPLVSVGLRQETLNLVLLLQSLWDILDPTAVNRMAMSL